MEILYCVKWRTSGKKYLYRCRQGPVDRPRDVKSTDCERELNCLIVKTQGTNLNLSNLSLISIIILSLKHFPVNSIHTTNSNFESIDVSWFWLLYQWAELRCKPDGICFWGAVWIHTDFHKTDTVVCREAESGSCWKLSVNKWSTLQCTNFVLMVRAVLHKGFYLHVQQQPVLLNRMPPLSCSSKVMTWIKHASEEGQLSFKTTQYRTADTLCKTGKTMSG